MLGNLGNLYSALGDTDQALQFYERQLSLAREIGYSRGEGAALINMGADFMKLGERNRAIACAEAGFEIFSKIQDPVAEPIREQLKQWRRESD